MSATAAILTTDEYEERKRFLDDIRVLSKSELEELYRILKKSRAEFSENSNGVFFDLCKLPQDIFSEMKKFMDFCLKTRDDEAQREEEERRAQEALVLGRD